MYIPETAFSDGSVIIYANEQTNSGVFITVEYIRHIYVYIYCII